MTATKIASKNVTAGIVSTVLSQPSVVVRADNNNNNKNGLTM
jgi:hypothetical protein